MDLGLKEKTAIIVGGSKGIGFATARAFLQEGAHVAICARKAEELKQAGQKLSEFGEVYTECVDATSDIQLYDFAAHVHKYFGSIDCWVNNVGASGCRSGEEYTPDETEFVISTCFKSTVYGCQAAFRYMKNYGGVIINISSLAARCATAGRATLYGPMKAAINSLTKTLAGEYAAYGVRVVGVMPGFTATPLVKATITPEDLAYNVQGTLLRRLAEPEEIAKPIVFLASSAASYMTASVLEVSGGRAEVLNPSYSYDKREQESNGSR
jgi:NAD(P)-dependent dehydrogenase (short-subunit alcohol dehydrogenase family)